MSAPSQSAYLISYHSFRGGLWETTLELERPQRVNDLVGVFRVEKQAAELGVTLGEMGEKYFRV